MFLLEISPKFHLIVPRSRHLENQPSVLSEFGFDDHLVESPGIAVFQDAQIGSLVLFGKRRIDVNLVFDPVGIRDAEAGVVDPVFDGVLVPQFDATNQETPRCGNLAKPFF